MSSNYKKIVDKISKEYETNYGIESKKVAISAIDTQVGGSHYKKLGIQPLELTYANFGYTGLRAAIYTKVNKYLSRDKDNHREDIEKARQILDMQLYFYDKHVLDQKKDC
jgi:hypothetical protein